MKTKPVYVYLWQPHGDRAWYSCSEARERECLASWREDKKAGYSVSPIVRVDVPLPARDEKWEEK